METPVIELGSPSVFSIEDANSRVRVINHFTKEVARNVDQLLARLESAGPTDASKTRLTEIEVEKIIESWNSKVKKLGGVPKGLWLVDFDAGDGYYCWKYPEIEVKFWHDRNSGFTGRIPLHEREKRILNELQPNL